MKWESAKHLLKIFVSYLKTNNTANFSCNYYCNYIVNIFEVISISAYKWRQGIAFKVSKRSINKNKLRLPCGVERIINIIFDSKPKQSLPRQENGSCY